MGTLISLFRRRGSDPFEDLLAPHVEHLYRLAYRFTGNREQAEDLVQDLLVKLYPRSDELAEVAQLRPWLARTLYHQFIDQKRREQRAPFVAEEAGLEAVDTDPRSDPEGGVERDRLQQRLTAALATLNPDQRALVALHDMEGYTLVELEPLLSTPLGTLKSRLHRARARLRSALAMEPSRADRRSTG